MVLRGFGLSGFRGLGLDIDKGSGDQAIVPVLTV